MTSFAESLAEKLPAEEREELIKFMADAWRSLSPKDRAELLDLRAVQIRAKMSA